MESQCWPIQQLLRSVQSPFSEHIQRPKQLSSQSKLSIQCNIEPMNWSLRRLYSNDVSVSCSGYKLAK